MKRCLLPFVKKYPFQWDENNPLVITDNNATAAAFCRELKLRQGVSERPKMVKNRTMNERNIGEIVFCF